MAGANVSGTVANATYALSSGSVANSLTINNSGTGSASGVTFNGSSAVIISYNTVGAPKADGTGASGTWGISITGNANVANTAITVAGANVTGQVAYAAIANSVAGANVSGQVANALVAETVYANAQPNITSVGTLTTLTVSGNANVGNLGTGRVIATGNISGTQLISNIATGTAPFVVTSSTAVANLRATAANTANTVTTAAQPNITSVGTLSSVTVSGISNLGAVGNVRITGGANGQVLTTNGSGNLSWTSISTLSTISNGNSNVNIPAANGNVNISAVGNANIVVVTGTGANINGYLTVTGNITASNANLGNAVIANYFIGSGANLTNINGANITGTAANANYAAYAGNVTIAGQSNITSLGTLTGLASDGVVNFANASNVNIGSVANMHIVGGSANYILQTDGSGTLSWVANPGIGAITTITPNALSSTVHIAANVVGNTANIITDATTANTANTIVVRDANGAINVNGWTVGTHLTAVNYTATNSDYWIGTTAKNKTITLPNAANGASNGRQYQIVDTVHTGNPGTTIAAQSPATVSGNQPSQQGQVIIATYIGGVWYLN